MLSWDLYSGVVCCAFNPKLTQVVHPTSHRKYQPQVIDAVPADAKRTPEATTGEKWLIVAADMLSRYVVAGILGDNTGAGVAELLVGRLFHAASSPKPHRE